MNGPRVVFAEGSRATVEVEWHEDGPARLLTARLRAAARVRVERVRVPLGIVVERMVEHGWQSWSAVRPCRCDDVRPQRAEAPAWFRRQMLADGSGAGRELAGDGVLVHDRGAAGFVDASRSFARVVAGRDGALVAEWLLDGVELAAGSEFELDALLVVTGDPGAAYEAVLSRLGEREGARVSRPMPPAWCSWYQYFGDVRPSDIRANIPAARELGVEVVQVDDGWQLEIGCWDATSTQWAEPISAIADDIRHAGMRAGLWTAPFLALEGGRLAREHPEWLVRGERRPPSALHHSGWGGRVLALDTTRPDVLEHLEETFAQLRDAGYSYFKIDFCHGAATPGIRHDVGATRAVALRQGLEAVRRGIGDEAYLVGCGCPLWPSVGVVDAMRVSEDVAPYWAPKGFVPGFEENSVSARSALAASLRRAPMHGRLFSLDPDCVLLRPVETELSAVERHVVAQAAAVTGGSIVLSDRLDLYGESERDSARQLFSVPRVNAPSLLDPLAVHPVVRPRPDGPAYEFDLDRATVREVP